MSFEDWPFTDSWSLHGNKEIVSRYEILERIGEGTFGEVYKARRREDSLIVALKEIHNSDSSDREVKALLLLDHPNVVKLHEYFVQGNNVVLVLEYLPYNLNEVIRASKGELLEREVKGWAIQVLQGLSACHAASVFHRDLKPTNLLIAVDGSLKIADFGQARILSEENIRYEEETYSLETPPDDCRAGNERGTPNITATQESKDLGNQAAVSRAEEEIGEPESTETVKLTMTTQEEESNAQGIRWYGAPRFQFSYMEESSKADTVGGKVVAEIDVGVTRGEGEWENGSEDGAFNIRGGLSQESSGRGDYGSDAGCSDFTTMVGTRWYKAPELLYGARKYGKEVDIWAVGCIFGELLLGKPLFPGTNDIDQLSRLVRILGPPNEKTWAGVSLLPDFNKICFVDDRSPLTLKNYLPNVSDFALQFLQKLLTYDPRLRPSAEETLVDCFFFKNPLPSPCHELKLPTTDKNEAFDEDWGEWKDPSYPGSPLSDFVILG